MAADEQTTIGLAGLTPEQTDYLAEQMKSVVKEGDPRMKEVIGGDKTTIPAYRWAAPAYHAGQMVRFWWNERTHREGVIGRVETHYRPSGEAWHTFHVCVPGARVGRYITEKDIICAE